MTTGAFASSSSHSLLSGLACLLLGGLLATLFSAYTLTGLAGLARLTEKYPRAKNRLGYWAPRWDTLRAALLLCSILMQVAFIAFAILSLGPPPLRVSFRSVGLLAVTVTLFAIAFNVLPRALSRSYADRFSVLSLPLVAVLARLLFPLAWPIARVGQVLHGVFMHGADDEHRPSPEDEIRSVLDRTPADDLEADEREIIHSVFEFGETVTREIMSPRVDIEGLEDTETVAACVSRIKASSHSRFPVYHETLDDIRGVVHVKDLLRLLDDGKEDQPVRTVDKETTFVPETMPINDLLRLLRSVKAQVAVVVDEYGGTAGLVTIEDIIEELVGEIQDEYDTDERRIQRLSDGSAVLDARLPVHEINELLDLEIPEDDDYESVGGYVFHALGRVPRPGERVDHEQFEITVQTANARQLHTLRVLKKEPAE